MFRKKHTVKEVQAIGKSDAKKIKASLTSLVGDDFADVLDVIWDKKAIVSRRRWQFGPQASVVLYLVNELPLVVAVNGLPAESADLVPKNAFKGSFLPTEFFLLRVHQLLADQPERYSAFLGGLGLSVLCRGPTSRFLLSGAHLMIPGILAVSDNQKDAGRLALIYSVGNDVPYAVGFTTTHLANGDDSGAGVYIVSCYKDSLWQEFEATFATVCSDKTGGHAANPVPPEFHEDEIVEILPASTAVASEQETYGGAPEAENGTAAPTEMVKEDVGGSTETNEGGQQQVVAEGDAAAATEAPEQQNDDSNAGEGAEAEAETEKTQRVHTEKIFPDEDAILRFSFCEAVKSISLSRLPLPLTQFTAAVVNAYPRVDENSKQIDFKKTKYKGALAFLKAFPDTAVIREVTAGVHSVTEINKTSPIMREHKRVFREFLAQVQAPALEKEGRAAEMRLLEDKKTVFNQQILSVITSYRARRDLNDDLARILLEGDAEGVAARETKNHFPTLEEAESVSTAATPQTDVELPPFDYDLFSNLYSRKALADNLRTYVKVRGLMVVDQINQGKGTMPSVKLQGALAVLASDDHPHGMPLNKVEETILKRHFNLTTEIVMQTSVSGSSAMSEFIPPHHVAKSGLPPRINVWTEKRSGNKIITLIKNLEVLGFDLEILSRAWRQKFSTSCSVIDPAATMQNLKSGTKIPVEIHLQGDFTGKLSTVLTNDLGIPSGLITYAK